MKKRIFTPEQIQAILADYRDRSITTNEICKKYDFGAGILTDIVKQHNEPLRNPTASKPKPRNPQTTQNKACPKCHKKINLKGARFCPYCGSDIRNENEILAERLSELTDLFYYVPETRRDEFVTALNQAADTLKKL